MPVPVSLSSVTVKVCGLPTSLVALGAIEIFAFDPVLARRRRSLPCRRVGRAGQRDAADADRRRGRDRAVPAVVEVICDGAGAGAAASCSVGGADEACRAARGDREVDHGAAGAFTKPLPLPVFTLHVAGERVGRADRVRRVRRRDLDVRVDVGLDRVPLFGAVAVGLRP